MATTDSIPPEHDLKGQRRRPFSTWVKKLTNFKSSDGERQKRQKKRSHKKNNPYPESGQVGNGVTNGTSACTFTTSQTGTTSTSVNQSARTSREDQAPPTIGGRSLAGTVLTDHEASHSLMAPSHRASSVAGTSRTVGCGVESRRGEDSTFSSPAPSVRSLTTTLTTIQSMAPNAGQAHHHAAHNQGNTQSIQFSQPFPSTGAPASAIPAHLAPSGNPTTYTSATANNLLTDNASILTLASSSKRRRRRSLDTDASVRALAPSSLWGGSRESLPLSVLSANIDPMGMPPTPERTSIYSATGVGPAISGDRNSYYAKQGDAASVRSGLLGHGRAESSSSHSGARQAPVAPQLQGVPPSSSRRGPSSPIQDNPEGFKMAISWKSFDFFDVAQITIADDEARQLFEGNEISSVCAGSDSLFLGSFDGYVSIINKSWKIVKRFQAYEAGSITHMRQVEGTSLLLTVAEDMSSEPVLKVWALDKLVKKTNTPTCLSTVMINNNRRQFPISAFAATEDLTQIAVGFTNGAVTVIRGELVHDLGTKQRIVFESEEPVTGVELAWDATQKLTTLFVSTTSRIIKLGLSKKGHGLPPKTVEDAGCAVGCMTRDQNTDGVIIARDDAIYTYTQDGRGPPKAYESPKSKIDVYHEYVALACPPASSTAKDSEAMRRRFGSTTTNSLFNASSFVLLDMDLRVIGHTETLMSPVGHFIDIWDDFYTILQDGKIYRYHEKSLQQRLEMLYQRNMFPLAIELAQKSGMDNEQQSLIYRRFGDHLYQKADYDGAMVQYIRAIDSTEPSQVIRKYLDTQRIHNLIQYLEQLHESRKATADHTTLLLNCYAKLKDINKLENFIKSPGDLKFDLDTAIAMCRQGGYYEQAAYLAKKHGETDLVVDILIEDSKNYAEALDYIWRQDPGIYARVLIENCPQDATKLFVDYYTGNYRPRRTVTVQNEIDTPASGGFAAGAASAVQNLSNLLPLPYMNTSSVASPGTVGNTRAVVSDGTIIIDSDDIPAPKYTPPPPRTAFSSFIDHADEFIIFLEACLEEKDLKSSDRTDLYTTLFEMYLYKAGEKKGQDHKEEWEAKAKKLIEGEHVPMESSNVLLLSHLADFHDGTVLVKEQAKLLFDIFRSYTSAKDTRGAMKALRKYGPEEPQLYPAALAYLTSDPKVLEEAGPDELANILNKIDKDGLMAPLQVIQTLVGQSSGGGVATMGMIKPYLHETITRERKEIASNRNRINTLRGDTEKRREELADLGSKPAVFQATWCSDCSQRLDLPAVHFLCKHSFHQRCVRNSGNDGDAECPKCASENDMIRKMREGQRERAGKHELFKGDLENSDDRFSTLAEWFSRGVMDGQSAEQI
ncbi:hypothetical protein BKA59DRAFT_491268 [Fusarium tricinctum]|uniref:RING-type domain-containing protein n=1 Tax=Fusarium tricinctum TaxID=61284 RepID=A0A8K0S6Q4_9HYPO|nr:hypothetical protein BKA59DRAFT_491268 [Fusarium tricinctum]